MLQEIEPIIKQKDLKTIDLLVQVNNLIESKIDYLIRMETGRSSPRRDPDKRLWLLPRQCVADGPM